MKRDHLRVVAANSAPSRVTQLESFSFAQVEGGLIVLHNDKRISAFDALIAIWAILEPVVAPQPAAVRARPRRRLPGDMGGDGLEAAEDPLFAENRHKRGYPAERPWPICAETEGDMA